MGLLNFQVKTLIGCVISFFIHGVPMLHTFDGPYYTKNKKYMKNVIAITFFMQQSPSKVTNMGTTWMTN